MLWMFLALVITLVICSPYLVWQFFIRPYCLKHGKGYTTGMNWAATMWVDWQEAKELATAKGDHKILVACRAFLWIHLVFFVLALGFIVISIAGG
ncbi:MAG: hypothetical protein NWT08_09935 [Akkermansiaceae bacterium]|jgi:hypothetical protein|nr:hypothetical protein [Akkermansiaceae bacterium]MDP4646938.1 hypothetical protein [Akkermansiaceae bacterium]MDP4898080.1 hypothetical protein [Akkermansiaceae bacterium]